MNIEKLKIIRDRLKAEIKPEEFDFQTLVTAVDDNGCGTVCCIIGWFPRLFPNAGFRWSKISGLDNEWTIIHEKYLIDEALILLTGCGQDTIDYLFYGGDAPEGAPRLELMSSYDEVLTAWDWFIENGGGVKEEFSLT